VVLPGILAQHTMGPSFLLFLWIHVESVPRESGQARTVNAFLEGRPLWPLVASIMVGRTCTKSVPRDKLKRRQPSM
jgi:hypothetical protein